MFNPAMLFLALEARRRGAGGAEIAPLLLPLPGPTGAMLSAVSTIRAQDRLNAMPQELTRVGVGVDADDAVKITEGGEPELHRVVTRKSRQSERDRREELETEPLRFYRTVVAGQKQD